MRWAMSSENKPGRIAEDGAEGLERHVDLLGLAGQEHAQVHDAARVVRHDRVPKIVALQVGCGGGRDAGFGAATEHGRQRVPRVSK